MKLHDSLAQNHSIRLQAEAETWQEAVKIGVDLLVAADVVTPPPTRRWASCRSLTCLTMKPISTVYAPAVASRKCWI